MLYFEQDTAPIYLKNHSGSRMSSIFTTPCPLQTRMVESVNNEILHDDIILKTNHENLGKNS